MSILNISAAAADTDPASRVQVLFSSRSTSDNSSTFNVTTQPYYIQAYELAEGDIVKVQIATGTGSGSIFADFSPLGKVINLTPDQNAIRIDWPGMYRLVFSGTAVTGVYVVGFQGTMTEHTTYGVAASNIA